MSRAQRSAAAVGCLLLLAYGLPLFVPPPATWPVPPPVDAGLWERLFPGVPAWWVVGRLVCLWVGAGLLAAGVRTPLPLRLGGAVTSLRVTMAQPHTWQRAQWLAFMLALGHAGLGFFAAHFNHLTETVYFLFLAVPAGVLASADPGAPGSWLAALRRRIVLLLVPLLWLVASIPAAWRSPRAASVVDMWIMVERLEDVVWRHHHILTGSASPGHTNAYMMLEGVSLIGSNRLPLSFAQLQIVHLFWAVVCALLVGAVVWKMIGRPAAIVAEAVFLFSQYVLSSPYSPGPTLIAPLCAGVLLLLALVTRETRSGAALAAFGAVAGFSSTEPTVAIVVLLLCALMAYSLVSFPRVPRLAVGTALLSGAAAALPGFPNLSTLAAMASQYAFGHRQSVGMVMILFGQHTPYGLPAALKAGRPALLDLPVAALLAPFAIARTPLRLWGDALLDPLGAILMTIGLAVCARHITRSRVAALMLALLAAALVQGFASSGDSISHNRLAAALVPMAVFAGIGFETIRSAFAPTRRPQVVAAVAAAGIAAAGVTVFAGIDPTILPASWVATSLEALGTRHDSTNAVLLEHGGLWNLSWLYVDRIAALVPARPLPSRPFSDFERMESTASAPDHAVYLWSPGLEHEAAVSRLICDRWPGAAIYTLWDPPGLFRAFAAAPDGAHWRPRLPPERWTVTFCQAPTCPF